MESLRHPKKPSLDPAKDYIAKKLMETFISAYPDIRENQEISEANLYDLLETPPQKDMGDYAFPCFRFAKLLRESPQKIAEKLLKTLDEQKKEENSWLTSQSSAGAFVNFQTNSLFTASYLLPSILDRSYFQQAEQQKHSDRVMVEFSQPNTHKEFHVGHVRNVCLGDTICRLTRYQGFDVIAANYIGDEGTHVAKCLWHVKKSKEDLPIANQSQWYGRHYSLASQLLKNDNEQAKVEYQKEISSLLKNLEEKSGSDFELWQKSRQACLEDFNRIYDWLHIKFDHFFYESEVSEESQKIVDEFIEKGLFTQDQGAYGIHLDAWNLGFLMVRKSDGTSLYITKDLALARRKFEDFHINKSVYVVASEQNLHFKQLFKALELMNFKQASQCHHLSYAHVRLPEGKMSSRDGNVFTFFQLIELVENELQKHLKKYQGIWTPEEIEETAKKLALGTIKYGMLEADPQKEIIFDPERWTSFEGNTGPYLMYSYARTCSILRKTQELGITPSFEKLSYLKLDVEAELIKQLYQFNICCQSAMEAYKPSSLTTYLFETCRTFNRFYAQASVLNSLNPEEQKARLTLVKATSLVLFEGLKLLGITPPERM